jgi:tetratricopeptide (TPR) repeat protein
VGKAQVEFQLGRYDRALEGYTRAYELYPVPGLLFNLGQCHRNLKNHERAIFFFEGYLRESPKLDKDQRALTEDLIAESRTGLEREQAEAQAAAAAAAIRAAAPPPVPRPHLSAAPPAPLVAIDRDHQQTPAPPRRSIARRWWFWTALGVAAAGGAAAYYFTGDPRRVPPGSTVGTLDSRSP